ncbi:MAG: hydroxyacylglutathione hydrolase [Gammaproteobacteria bacterium]|nr:hydroxyacylglutathione hydrolase [Gammaproteobacteria bacterium]
MSNNYQIFRIAAFSDNYIWALVNDKYCAIVDPGEAAPVIEFLIHNKLTLTDILITHHHPDHIGGIDELQQRFAPINIFGPTSDRFPMVTQPCIEGDVINLSANIELNVLELHGHTRDHIGYYDVQHAFVGDTLFSAGCGRLFEGTPEQMFESLQKLQRLGDDIKVFCAHEYTQNNIKFALVVDPNNTALLEYQQKVRTLRNKGAASIPTTIGIERQVNPFLRCHDRSIKHNIEQHFNSNGDIKSDTEYFALLRQWKDNF